LKLIVIKGGGRGTSIRTNRSRGKSTHHICKEVNRNRRCPKEKKLATFLREGILSV